MTGKAGSLALAGIICLGTVFAIPNQRAFAHTFFRRRERFVSCACRIIKTELDLAQSNLASNVTLAEDHAAHAHEHLDEDVIEEISERNERLGRDLPAALEDLHHSVTNSTAQQNPDKDTEYQRPAGRYDLRSH